MGVVVGGKENGQAITGDQYGFVLTMRESLTCEANENDFIAGNAILIAENFAITSIHCLLDRKLHLSVRSAIYPHLCAKVKALIWRDGKSFWFKSGEKYPDLLDSGIAEDIVGLLLEPFEKSSHAQQGVVRPLKSWDVLESELQEEEGAAKCEVIDASRRSFSGLDVTLMAPDRVQSGYVRRFSFSTRAPNNGLVLAEAIEPCPGFPLESGAAIISSGDASAPFVLRGLQVSAPGVAPPLAPLKPGSFIGSVIGILPLNAARIVRMREWVDGKIPSASSGNDLGTLTPLCRFRIRHYRDGHVISGSEDLIELNDLSFFHAKVWRLYAVRMGLGVLKTDAKLWTQRIAQNQVQLTITAADSWESTSVTLYAAGNFSVGGFFWLYGRTQFRGKVLHCYLFRLSDLQRGANLPPLRRIRVAVFDMDGPHLGDRPDYHNLELGSDRAIIVNFSGAAFRSDDDRVQDDVGNGHEGHDVP